MAGVRICLLSFLGSVVNWFTLDEQGFNMDCIRTSPDIVYWMANGPHRAWTAGDEEEAHEGKGRCGRMLGGWAVLKEL